MGLILLSAGNESIQLKKRLFFFSIKQSSIPSCTSKQSWLKIENKKHIFVNITTAIYQTLHVQRVVCGDKTQYMNTKQTENSLSLNRISLHVQNSGKSFVILTETATETKSRQQQQYDIVRKTTPTTSTARLNWL